MPDGGTPAARSGTVRRPVNKRREERIRSDAASRPDNVWGFPSYALQEAVRDRTVSPLWQVLVEPVFADYYTPRLGMVLDGLEREARRIGYWDMVVPGEVRMVRRRAGGGYFTVLTPGPGTSSCRRAARPADPGPAPRIHHSVRRRLADGLVGGQRSAAGALPSLAIPRWEIPVIGTALVTSLVIGVLCKHGHFNDPKVPYCSVCGISMTQLTRVPAPGPRPPLGVLTLDDGTAYPLERGYVLGRTPARDELVRSGRASPLPLADRTVSRVHARVLPNGWPRFSPSPSAASWPAPTFPRPRTACRAGRPPHSR